MTLQQDNLLRWRKQFPILQNTTYLISNSLGAMPRSVYDAMHSYAETWATRGVLAWADAWWNMSVTVGDTIASFIGAKPGEISMHTNISLIQSILISCFDFSRKRNTVVYTDMEFPSVMYAYERFATAQGARLRIVRSRDRISVDTQQLLDAIDERTLLVPISHVLFKSSAIVDIKAIVARAHSVGATVILDAYHSVGIIPVDVRDLGVDVLVGGVLKWLCGGPGGAFLWINPSLRKKLKPKITGWMAHQHPFAFDESMAYATDATRFLNGTPSIPALYAAQEGPRIIAKVGIKNIRAKSKRQTALLVTEAQRFGFKIVSPMDPERRAGTITMNVPHAYEISRELLERNILVDYRKGAGIRIAPHFYTTDAEIKLAVNEINEILQTKSYRKHSPKRSTVT